jgi:hypothetical protein
MRQLITCDHMYADSDPLNIGEKAVNYEVYHRCYNGKDCERRAIKAACSRSGGAGRRRWARARTPDDSNEVGNA